GALGVQLDELAGELFGGGLGAGLGALPLRAAHLAQLDGVVLPRAYVLADQVELRRRDVERVAAGVGYLDVVLLDSVHGHAHDSGEAAYAVVLVHHEVADGQVGVRGYALGVRELAARLALRLAEAAAGYLRVRQHGQAQA